MKEMAELGWVEDVWNEGREGEERAKAKDAVSILVGRGYLM